MTGDPSQLWRNQPSERPEIGLDVVRRRLATQKKRLRRSRWALAATSLTGVLLSASLAYRAEEPVIRFAEALLAAGFVLLVVIGWPRLPTRGPDDGSECAIYLRNRLVEQRRALAGGWLLKLAPLAPGFLALFGALAWLAGDAWLPRMGPIVLFFVVWLCAALVIRRREQKRIEGEIAELDRLAGQGPGV